MSQKRLRTDTKKSQNVSKSDARKPIDEIVPINNKLPLNPKISPMDALYRVVESFKNTDTYASKPKGKSDSARKTSPNQKQNGR